MVLCGRRNTFATFSEDAFVFSWKAQQLRRVVLRAFVSRIVSAASSGDKVQIPCGRRGIL